MSAAPIIAGESALAPADWPKVGQIMDRRDFGPFNPTQLASYAAVSGDDNPLHLDPDAAASVGLKRPPIHGMLMMSCFEPAVRQWRSDVAILGLAGKFLRPVLVGESINISGRVVCSSLSPRPELVLRVMAHGSNGDLAILAEARLQRVSSGAL